MSKKRRGRGEGGVEQRGPNCWQARISLGYHSNGKRRRIPIYGKTKAEVLDRIAELRGQPVDGSSSRRLTLEKWLKRWLELTKPHVEPNTYAPYERHVRLHIVPYVGQIQLGKLVAVHIQGLYSSLAGAGVSAAMQQKVGSTLTIALNEAVRLNMLAVNVATKVRKPKVPKREIQVFDPDELGKFLHAARTSRLYPFYLTALDSGARPGELFALLWDDVDFTGNFISITKSLEDHKGQLRVKPPKTAKSRRRIDLSAETVAVLAEHRRAALAAGWITSPVFHDTIGGYLRLSNVYADTFKPLLKRAGLPSVGLYTLRHTCATLLLLADQPAKVVSERLGHSSVKITLDTYSHVLPTMQKRAASVLGMILDKAQKACQA